jgi:hypothetical protein
MIQGQEIKATRILAKSLFKELRGNGYSPNQILSLSTELIDLVTQGLKEDQDAVPAPPAADAEGQAGGWRAAL